MLSQHNTTELCGRIHCFLVYMDNVEHAQPLLCSAVCDIVIPSLEQEEGDLEAKMIAIL